MIKTKIIKMNSWNSRHGGILFCSWFTIFFLPFIRSQETFCPPPVEQFLKMNKKSFKATKENVVYMNEVIEEEVVRLSLRKNPYYSSPKCSVLETDNSNGYKYFGVREEYDAKTFTRKEECQVYLARTGFGQESVHLTVLVIAQVIPGLSTECQVKMSARPSFHVKFCAQEWSCAEEEEDEEEKEEERENDVEGSHESCAEEWGCIGSVDTEKEEEKVEHDSVPNCSGEWGCFDNDVDTVENEVDREEPEFVDTEIEFVTKSLAGIVPEARMLNNTNTSMTEDKQDIVDQLIETLMSSNMAPLTLSMLILLGVVLLLGMWCLCCRGTCKSSRKYDRSDSMSSSISQDTKIIIGTLQREKNNSSRLSRNSSVRSSMRSCNSNVFDDDLVMYFGDEEEDDKDCSAEEIVVSGKRKLFTVSEEIDPTEEGLESLEWDTNAKNENKSVPLYQKSHCQNVDHSHLHNDFPSFYI